MGANARKRAARRAESNVTALQYARREAAQIATRPPNVEELLYQLGKTHRYLLTVDQKRTRLVRDARAAGASWSEIGAQLSMTRQGARQRFFEGNRSEAEGGSHD